MISFSLANIQRVPIHSFRQVLPLVEFLLQLSDLRDVLSKVSQASHQGAGQDVQANTSSLSVLFQTQNFLIAIACVTQYHTFPISSDQETGQIITILF